MGPVKSSETYDITEVSSGWAGDAAATGSQAT